MQKVKAYTDGSCFPNPGPGGWGLVIVDYNSDKVVDKLYGGEKETTSNRMEIIAVIKALEYFTDPVDITIYSDSQYVVKSIKYWIYGWEKQGFDKAKSGQLKNKDLWRTMWILMHKHLITLHWIPSHKGIELNELADELALKGRLKVIGVKTKRKMSKTKPGKLNYRFVVGKEYKYDYIESSMEGIAEMQYFGEDLIGAEFLVFKMNDNPDMVMSFVLTGATGPDSIYKLIYSDYE